MVVAGSGGDLPTYTGYGPGSGVAPGRVTLKDKIPRLFVLTVNDPVPAMFEKTQLVLVKSYTRSNEIKVTEPEPLLLNGELSTPVVPAG